MGVKICPKCNGKVSDTRIICPHCQYDFSVKKIICPDCNEEIDAGLAECPVCGYYFDAIDESSDDVDVVESAPIPMAKVSIKESNPNSSNVHLAKFRRKITKEQFLRSVLIELSLDPDSPADILSAEFGEVEEAEIQGYLIQGVASGSYSGLIGIDRVEEYVTQEQKYVPSGTHYTSGGIGFYEKEGARHLVDVTKTKTVTDWQIHNGEIINEHHSAVKTELGYEDFESSFWKLFRRDDLDKIHDESIDNEKLPNGFYDKGIDLLRNDVVNSVSWPGDHQKDESFNILIDNYRIYRCIVPTYQVSCVYKGQVCLIQGFAIDEIAPVIEKLVSTSSNSVEGLKREEDVEINKKKKITLSAKIVAILAAISGFVGFIILVSGGKPLPLFIGFLAGIAASICLGVVAYVNIASIKKKYEMKTQQLSYMKYMLLKQELDKRGFPELTDEEKDALQYSMGIDSLEDIDDTFIFEELDAKNNKEVISTIKEETVTANESIKVKKPKTKKDKKKFTKKQIGIIGLISGLIICITLSILTFTVFIPNSQPFVFKENGDGYSLKAINKIESPDVVIPETYKGKPVTNINSNIFYKCKDRDSIISITIPDSVTFISYNAFWGCTNVESIKGPVLNSENFVYIFGVSGVPNSLKEVIITSGTSIESCEFYDHDNLTHVAISNTITTIGNAAFAHCSNLRSVVIGESVSVINTEAFGYCDHLEYIYYFGTYNEWNNIEISVGSGIEEEIIYYYSETEPTEEGNYWHYIGEVPVVWE